MGLSLIDKFLLVYCFLCSSYFCDRDSCRKHVNQCIHRALTLSLFYAEPLSYELFQSTYSKIKRLEDLTSHAVKQIQALAAAIFKEVSTENSGTDRHKPIENPFDNPILTTFEEIICQEAEMSAFTLGALSTMIPKKEKKKNLSDS